MSKVLRYDPNRSDRPMSGGSAASQSSLLDLGSIADVLRRGWWLILLTFVVLTGAVTYFAYTTPEEYRSASIVAVNRNAPRAPIGEGILFGESLSGMANEIELLRQSEVIARQVAIKLVADPTRTIEGEELSERTERITRLAKTLRWQMEFSTVGQGVDMIRIAATNGDPMKAAAIANAYAEVYVDRGTEKSRESISASEEFLIGQEEKYSIELASVESEMENFLRTQDAVGLDGKSEGIVMQLADLDAQLSDAEAQLQIERNGLQVLEEELRTLRPKLEGGVSSSLERELGALREFVAETEMRIEQFYVADPSLYGNEEREPELVELKETAAGYREKIKARSQIYVDQMLELGPASGGGGDIGQYVAQLNAEINRKRIEVRSLEMRVNTLGVRITKQDARLEQIPSQSIRLAQLQRRQQSAAQLHGMIEQKLQEARIAKESEVGSSEIVRRAAVPLVPVRPNKPQMITLGALLGLFFGFGLALLRTAMDRKIYSPKEVRELGYTVLGVIPDYSSSIKKALKSGAVQSGGDNVDSGAMAMEVLAPVPRPLSIEAEAYRHLRTGVRYALRDRKISVLLVTSPGPSEGKSLTASNLAIVMAQAGQKTLLLDLDLRKPTINKMFGFASYGVTDVLFDRVQIDWESTQSPVANLFVLPAGRPVRNPSELLDSRGLRSILEDARQHFDTIIIDSPPVHLVTDAAIAALHCDGGLMVATAGKVDNASLNGAIETLERVGLDVLGVVFNKANPSTLEYGYGGGYGDEYFDVAADSRFESRPRFGGGRPPRGGRH